MPTIRDVASRAGVSVTTVSRVLNGSDAVRAETRAQVHQAIAELGYRPNSVARGLSSGRTATIGVVAPLFSQPGVLPLLRGAADTLEATGQDMVLAPLRELDDLPERLRTLGNRQVDGVLLLAVRPPSPVVDALIADDLPAVLVGAIHPRLPHVVSDDRTAGRVAARHLLRLGHRRVAVLADLTAGCFGVTAAADRQAGCAAAFAEAGCPLPSEYLLPCPPTPDGAVRVLEALLAHPSPPTALVASSGLQALVLRGAMATVGCAVPGELSLLAIDGTDHAGHIGLTAVRAPLAAAGSRGAQRLLHEIAGGVPAGPLREMLQPDLALHSSTGPPCR